jgi:hypothetical protein
MIYGSIISAIFILGFAYIIMTLANKESGNSKLAGQIIAALVAIVALVVLVLGATGWGHHGMMRGGMMGGCMMGDKGMMGGKSQMMMEMMKKDPSMMQEICKNKEMRDMMQKGLKKYGK